MHFLADPPGSEHRCEVSSEAWNRRVDGFDAEGLAHQLKEVGADYFCLSLGQNSGHYCSPNATYDSLTGIVPSKCSRRDLVADMAEALSRHGLPLLVYLPSGAPEFEPQAVARLEWKKNGGRLVSFQRKWERIIREWSLRWGSRVKGWWIDGCYYAQDMYLCEEEPNFRSLSEALRAGNPQSLVAFNRGLSQPFRRLSPYEDFTAGETAGSLPVFHDLNPRPPDGLAYHLLSFLGSFWGSGKPRFPDDLVVSFTRYTHAHGGRITWDVPFEENGLIKPDFIRQLRVLHAALES